MNGRGQFSIIASLLVAVVLVTTVIITYSIIRNSPVQDQPQIMSPIDETNLALKQVLGFTVGYYGSVLQVTGNSTYARELAASYLQNGTTYVANMHPEYGTSLNLTKIDMQARWFSKPSYSIGNIEVNYNLTALGIYGITYESSCKLMATTGSSITSDEVSISVIKDDDEPLINLGKESFKFYNYSFTNSTWKTVSPSNMPAVFANGTYLVKVPAGIDTNAYTVQIQDLRGLTVTTSSFSRYICTMDWNKTLYSTLPDTTLVVELLQNGTMKWLGQNLNQTKPVPPVPVRSIHVNQTINNVDQEVPFQIEDWTSNFKIPLGLSNNASIFNSGNMLVFLVNPRTLNKTTIWWDGRDTDTQTPQAYVNRYFTVNQTQRTLTNGNVTLQIDFSGSAGSFKVNSTVGTATGITEYMRINNKVASASASASTYAITNGPVRVVVQHEVEWSNFGVTGCPNVYAQIVITLPANVTYYTYQLRLIFANSTQARTLSDLGLFQLSSGWMSGTVRSLTENGTSSDLPTVAETLAGQTDLFYNFSDPSTGWAHHWSEYIDGSTGAGMMFTNESNIRLYSPFDAIAGQRTGALNVTMTQRANWATPTAVADRCGQDVANPAPNSVDSNTGTYWRHNSPDNHWIILDMGKTASISKMRIYQHTTDPSRRWGQANGIEIYVSNDTSTWVSVWNGTLDAPSWQESGTFSILGRYVKLYSRSTSSLQRLYEVNVQTNEKQTTIEFNPVDQYPASFTYPLDVTWNGAIVTFDGATPIYKQDGTGLWVLVECPPAVTVTVEN